MRYSGWALLVFGAGALLGLVIVVTGPPWLGWAASLTMAVSLAALPVTLIADWWSHRPWRKPPAKRRAPARKRSPRQSKSSPIRRKLRQKQ